MAADEEEVVFPVTEMGDAPFLGIEVADGDLDIDGGKAFPDQANGELGFEVIAFAC